MVFLNFSLETEKRILLSDLYKSNESSFPQSLVNIYFTL